MLKNEDNVPPVEKLGRTNKIFCIRHYLGDSSNKELEDDIKYIIK